MHEQYRTPYIGAPVQFGHQAACLEQGAPSESILAAILQVTFFNYTLDCHLVQTCCIAALD